VGMEEPQEAQFVCSVCHAAFTQRDIERKLAVIRHGEVLCIDHFEEKYPDECLNHPGAQATEKCDQCGRMVCKDCIIELAGETACPKCKTLRMAEIFTGRQIEPKEEEEHRHIPTEESREYIKRLREENKLILQTSPPTEHNPADPAMTMWLLVFLSILLPGFGVIAIIVYTSKWKPLFDMGYYLKAKQARIAYFIIVVISILWGIALLLIFINLAL